MGGEKKYLRHPYAMKDKAIKEMKPPASDSRTIRSKKAKAGDTTRKSSQKHSAVKDARATRPSKNRTASRVAPRVIPINHSLEATASRQQSLGSGRISDHNSRAAGREEQVPWPILQFPLKYCRRI